jgi:hypothetical protein
MGGIGLEEALRPDDRCSDAPIVIEQATASAGRLVLLAVLGPLLFALMIPFWLVVSRLASDGAAREIMAHRPLSALQLALGLIVVIGIFGWPLIRLADGVLRRRRVAIDNGVVVSEHVGLVGGAGWAEPLAAYRGVARRVRTTLSGPGEELVLIHDRPSRSVLLLTAPRIAQETVESATRLFALAEIPSREASNVWRLRRHFRRSEPQTRLSAAHA